MNNDTGKIAPRKIKVEDANVSDEKIPRNLILMYGTTPYIQKAGLEWKANQLFGGAGYSIKMELIENDRAKSYVLAKATLTVLKNGATFENYGEASLMNTNSMMAKQLLHLAITRAECRVLRMATATGYASYDEVATTAQFIHSAKPVFDEPADKTLNEPATEQQISTMKKLGYEWTESDPMTNGQAIEWILNVTKRKAKSEV